MGLRKTVNKKSLTIIVLGQKWKFIFWSPAHFLKFVSTDSKGELTDYDRRVVSIDLCHLSAELLRHELTHVYAKERSIVELKIKNLETIEDFFCEINGKHGDVLCKQARHLHQVARKLKWKRSS